MNGRSGTIHVIDDDEDLARSLARLFVRQGWNARAFVHAREAELAHRTEGAVCLVTDVMLGGAHGFDLAKTLRAIDPAASIVFMTAWPATSDAVDAIRRHGGVDYLEKPLDEARLLAAVREGLDWSASRRRAESRLKDLSSRERQILDLVIQGKSSKTIALELDISPKTVEDHRASIRAKTGAATLEALIKLTMLR